MILNFEVSCALLPAKCQEVSTLHNFTVLIWSVECENYSICMRMSCFTFFEHVYRCRRFCCRCHSCYAFSHCHFDYNVQLFLVCTSLCIHHIAVLILVLIMFIPSQSFTSILYASPQNCGKNRIERTITIKRKDHKNDKSGFSSTGHWSLELQDMLPTKDLHSIKPTLIAL